MPRIRAYRAVAARPRARRPSSAACPLSARLRFVPRTTIAKRPQGRAAPAPVPERSRSSATYCQRIVAIAARNQGDDAMIRQARDAPRAVGKSPIRSLRCAAACSMIACGHCHTGRKPLNKFIAFAFILGLSGTAVQAMPLAPEQAPASMTIKVAGGCGIGFHRGPYGGCRPNGREVVVVPGAAVVVAPGPGPCGGRGRHRVCGIDGRCVMVCN
jgi:hypothetical protein